MSTFDFLKKDLEQKIVKTQGGGNFVPQTTPQPTNDTLSSSLLIYRPRYNYILLNLYSAMWRPNTLRLFVRLSPSLFYTRSREKMSLSWDSRNE